MMSLYCNSKDPDVLYGVRHFIEKYGIPIKLNEGEDPLISIVYGDLQGRGNFLIKIPEKNIDTKIIENIRELTTNNS